MYQVVLVEKVIKWLNGLPEVQHDSMSALIELLENHGYELTLPYSKTLMTGKSSIKMKELRCKEFGNRLYYFHLDNSIYICTNGGDKRKQNKDIKLSIKIANKIIKEKDTWLK